MQDRFKFRIWDKKLKKIAKWGDNPYHNMEIMNYICVENPVTDWRHEDYILMQCTGLKDKNGKLIYEGDIIVIPNQYPFYDYKNKEDMKQDLYSTEGEIKGESILNYIGIVEWIYSQWQYVYHCVNPSKQGISEGINQGLNELGFDETENTYYEIIGNIYENPELLSEVK